MEKENERKIEKKVEECMTPKERSMDAAKAGGGFILGVGDQTPYATPEANLRAFVTAGHELGIYS